MCDYCGDMDRKHTEAKRPLVEGVVGSKIVAFFKENGYEAIPVEAEFLGFAGKDIVNYRLTFDDESVADCQLVFEPHLYGDVLSVEEYNRVI